MHVSRACQVVLRDAALSAKLAESLTERDAGCVGVLIEMLLHPAMLDVPCQSVQSDMVGSALV
jgi:hypothetical protein